MRRAVLALAAVLVAGPALAQERTDEQKKMLADLAGVMGRSHALRQVCEGPEDLYWRARFTRLVDTEMPDAEFEATLVQGFNGAFNRAREQFPACGTGVRRALAAAAGEGRALAGQLSQVVHRVPKDEALPEASPEAMAEEPEAR